MGGVLSVSDRPGRTRSRRQHISFLALCLLQGNQCYSSASSSSSSASVVFADAFDPLLEGLIPPTEDELKKQRQEAAIDRGDEGETQNQEEAHPEDDHPRHLDGSPMTHIDMLMMDPSISDLTKQFLQYITPENQLFHVEPHWYERDDHEGWTYPTFEDIHKKLYGHYSNVTHVTRDYSNPYQLEPNYDRFPHSNLTPDFFLKKVINAFLPRIPSLIVEVGSFQGHSSSMMASVLDALELYTVPLLCIDPWTGDLNIWANKDRDPAVQEWASPVKDGRSLLFDHFMTNIQSKVVDGSFSPYHILPFHATSFVGARFLKSMKWHPDFIFLDSSHELHETIVELRQYYEVLAPGGVLFGDDFSWPGVRQDLMLFVAEMGWGKNPENVFSFEIVRAIDEVPHSVLMWVIRKAKYK